MPWKHPAGESAGRSTIWRHLSMPLRFTFGDVEVPPLNMKWIENMMYPANSTGGIEFAIGVIETPAA